ncbi:DUF1289 domain-containing protein [Rhodocyclus tenuis]|uniref:DUF1289 domain-containing protein n=1 Tax=Rhodocyclus tenuis TaxID=1066 RepID=UPI001903231B|nr:DUF1289 domain-containing protein [Rhodocyclus tenuis]
MSEEPECIGMCEYDPESGICLGCGRLPECAAAGASVKAGSSAAGSTEAVAASPADGND